MTGANPTPEHLARQPFGKAPEFEHDGLARDETDAIVRQVDEVFTGPGTVPADARARMNRRSASSAAMPTPA
jgi:glutathione S-transferase